MAVYAPCHTPPPTRAVLQAGIGVQKDHPSGGHLLIFSMDTFESAPLELPASTLALLDEHFLEKDEKAKRFIELVDEENVASVEPRESRPLSVDEFRDTFCEAWGLSQFWCVGR